MVAFIVSQQGLQIDHSNCTYRMYNVHVFPKISFFQRNHPKHGYESQDKPKDYSGYVNCFNGVEVHRQPTIEWEKFKTVSGTFVSSKSVNCTLGR